MLIQQHACPFTAQNEAADGRNEAGQERVERKTAHQTAVQKLGDAGQHDVEQIRIDDFQLLGRVVLVLMVELVQHDLQAGHDEADVGTEVDFGTQAETHRYWTEPADSVDQFVLSAECGVEWRPCSKQNSNHTEREAY